MENNKPITAEEILRNKFSGSFLDLEYLELIIEAMEEYAQSAQQQPQGSELPSEVLIPLTDAVAFAQWRGSEHGLDTDAMTLVEEYNAFLQSQSKQKGETSE